MLKLKITERGSREFYEEFYYIVASYGKVIKNPQKKASSILKNNIVYFILTGLLIIVLYLFFVFDKDYISFTLATILLFALILFIRIDRSIRKTINSLMDYKGAKEIDLSKSKIVYKDNEKEMISNMDQISCILINKYSICFLPKERTGVLIALPVDYKKDIVKFLKQEKLEELLVDNSDKYKI
jgi:hypothetical protein